MGQSLEQDSNMARDAITSSLGVTKTEHYAYITLLRERKIVSPVIDLKSNSNTKIKSPHVVILIT